MAYQNVSTPRFYINMAELLNYNLPFPQCSTLPVSPITMGEQGITGGLSFTYFPLTSNSFIAHLGHNLGTFDVPANSYYYLREGSSTGDYIPLTGIVNSEFSGIEHNQQTPYDGFSIATFNGDAMDGLYWNTSSPWMTIGSIIPGTYYDMPQSANLSLSLSYEYDGVKKITTKGGSELSYNRYTSGRKWGDLGAWELYDGNPNTYVYENPVVTSSLGRSGRKSWDLKFSFMDDGDLWGSNQLVSFVQLDSRELDDGDTQDNAYSYNILNDDNFFSQVWHKTRGDVLPFIFQPDNSNNKPDQFFIAKFKNNSLKATQSAFNVYDISLTIEEVW